MSPPRRGSTGYLVLLTTAQAAGQAGTWAAYTAALPAALAQPHPAAAVSMVTLAWGVPSIGARLAGGVVDRHGPRRIGAAAWALAALAAAVPTAVHLPMPALLATLAAMSAGGTWGGCAGDTAPTWLPGRPDLAAAGAWLVIATSLPLALGPAGAASLASYAGDHAAWALVAGLSATAALVSLAVPATPPANTPPGGSPPARPRRRQVPGRVLAVFIVTAGVYVTFGVVTVLEPLYVRQILHAPLTVYGWLLATYSITGITVAVAVRGRPGLIRARWCLPAATVATAAGEALYLSTPIIGAAFAGAAVFGAGAALFRLAARAVLVHATPAREHGRVLSWWETIQNTSSAAPALVTGTLIAVLGLRVVLACASAGAAAVGALGAASGALRPARMADPGPAERLIPAEPAGGRR